MADASFLVQVDWNGDNSWSLVSGTLLGLEDGTGNLLWEDGTDVVIEPDAESLTPYVISANWQIGFARAFDTIARDSTATIILRNSDGRFSPESAVGSSRLAVGKRLRIQSVYSATTRTMFIGWIGSIAPAPGIYDARTATITCYGYLARARAAQVFIPVQEAKTANQVIDTIITASAIYPPGYYTAGDTYLTAEVGETTFNYIGDKWIDGTSLLGALRNTAGREVGRLWVDRSGVIQFTKRHHWLLDTTNDGTINGTMAGMDYAFGDNIINDVTVRAEPRTVSGGAVTLATLDRSTLIAASSSIVVAFRYTDTTANARIAGKNAITPVQTTDFTANTAADGSGTDKTSDVTAVITTESATRSEVTFTNAFAGTVYLQSGAKIRGTKITSYPVVDTFYQDATSIAAYGRLALLWPDASDNVEDAQGFADYLGLLRSTARGSVRSVTLKPRANDALMTSALSLTVASRVSVSEAQTGSSASHFIMGEMHSFKADGKDYTVKWLLEAADTSVYWTVGVVGKSEVGDTTFVAPM